MFNELNRRYGPYTVDACCDINGHNAHVSTRFYTKDRSFLNTTPQDFDKDIIWMNPPYDDPAPFLEHYLKLKADNPSIGLTVVLPRWKGRPWRALLDRFKLIKQFPSRKQLFTKPKQPGLPERVAIGPTRWPVQVWHDPPKPPPPAKAIAVNNIKHEETTEAPPASTSTPTPSIDTAGQPIASLVNLTDHRLDDQLIVFHGEAAGNKVKILLDSGASRNFASRDFVRRANIAPSMGDRLRVRQANGQVIATDLHAELVFSIGAAKFEEGFVITDLGAGGDHPYDLILGKPWLTRHNPAVDWTTNTVQVHGAALTGVVQQRSAAVTVLSATKMAKLLRKHEATMFLGTLNAVDPENAAPTEPPTLQEALSTANSGQSPE